MCKTRKQRRVNGLCDPCNTLTDAEGTKKKLGIPVMTAASQANLKLVKEYNRLIRKGVMQVEIAEMWGWPADKLRNMLTRMHGRHGVKVESARELFRRKAEQGTLPQERKGGAKPNLEHGGGKMGRRDCIPRCELCAAVYKATRAAISQRYRAKKQAQQQQQQQKPS